MTLKAVAKSATETKSELLGRARARTNKARLGVGEQTGSSAAKSLSTWVNERLALLFFQCRSPRLDCVSVLMRLNGNRAVRFWRPKVETERMGALPTSPG
jgi:hypothetical protein